MGLLGFITGELIEVIEWLDSSNDTLVWRFPDDDHEIKTGAKLTVREGQAAVFINEGKLADVFKPGLYSLTTQNIPVLTTLKSWKHGFESPFKAEVYFINTRQFQDMRWGTQTPIMLRDADFGAVSLRAFGTYAIRVAEPATFMREVVGTDGHYKTSEIENTLRSQVVSAFTSTLGQAKIPALDLAANLAQLGKSLREQMEPELVKLGLALPKFVVESVNLPPELQKALDSRGSMGILGDLGKYQQYQAANAMADAAKTPGSAAGAGLGLGAGIAMGQAMAGALQPAAAPAAQPGGAACGKCGERVPASSKFCPACGHAQAPAGTAPCVACQQPVQAGAKFCGACGAPQKRACPECKTELAPGAKFCGSCGHKLA